MGKEQLQKLALAAEVIGGAAVVITLVFLVLETRDNTQAVKSQTYLALTSELNRVRENLQDPETARIFSRSLASDELPESGSEAIILRQVFESAFAIYENAWYARRRGVLDDNEWGRFGLAICRNMRFAAYLWEPNELVAGFDAGIRGGMTEPFVEYAEAYCDWPAIKRDLESGTTAAQ